MTGKGQRFENKYTNDQHAGYLSATQRNIKGFPLNIKNKNTPITTFIQHPIEISRKTMKRWCGSFPVPYLPLNTVFPLSVIAVLLSPHSSVIAPLGYFMITRTDTAENLWKERGTRWVGSQSPEPKGCSFPRWSKRPIRQSRVFVTLCAHTPCSGIIHGRVFASLEERWDYMPILWVRKLRFKLL